MLVSCGISADTERIVMDTVAQEYKDKVLINLVEDAMARTVPHTLILLSVAVGLS
jgi:hypothetical protein